MSGKVAESVVQGGGQRRRTRAAQADLGRTANAIVAGGSCWADQEGMGSTY